MSIKVAFIGAPATGKSTLSMLIASEMKIKGLNTAHVVEYPRIYIEEYEHPIHNSEQLIILEKWKQLIDQASRYDYIICDNAPFVSWIYALYKTNLMSPKEVMILNEIHKKIIEDIFTFDHVFYMPINNSFEINDNLRVSDSDICLRIDRSLKGMIESYKINVHEYQHPEYSKKISNEYIDTIIKIITGDEK
jgi:adenylate kinase family enzyme